MEVLDWLEDQSWKKGMNKRVDQVLLEVWNSLEDLVGTGVQETHGSSSGGAEGGAVVPHKVRVGRNDHEHLIGGFYVEKVILLDCFQEPFGEGLDRMVRRGRGEDIFLVWSLEGVSIQGVLMERSGSLRSWIDR